MYALVVLGVISLLVPSMYVSKCKELYEIRRFEEVAVYMEQMLYSFQRRNKVLSALEDTRSIFSEDKKSMIYRTIDAAISRIQTDESPGVDVYGKAFQEIEQVYPSNRLHKMNRFMANVEYNGGKCEKAIEILIQDRNHWVDRMKLLQTERKNVRVKTLLGIGMSFLVCAMAVSILPDEFDTSRMAASQMVTAIVFLLNFLVWYLVDRRMSDSLIEEAADIDPKALEKSYANVKAMHPSEFRRRQVRGVLIALFPCVLLTILFHAKGLLFGSVFVGIAGILPKHRLKRDYKRVCTHVEKVFPEWLMTLSLKLQTDNLYMAILETMEDADSLLKTQLQQLLEQLTVHPDALEPFVSFFEELDLPDLRSAMRMLYSLSTYGVVEDGEQITAIQQRNVMLMDRAEVLKIEDQLMGLGTFVLIPMITGVIKMITDLALMISLITTMSTVVT
jgi:hypothetical protein